MDYAPSCSLSNQGPQACDSIPLLCTCRGQTNKASSEAACRLSPRPSGGPIGSGPLLDPTGMKDKE